MNFLDRKLNRKSWKKKIENWVLSKQKGSEWCHKNNESYRAFIYWKQIFYQTKKKYQLKNHNAFIEISDKQISKDSAIEMQYKCFSIRVNRGFDKETLHNILCMLRNL